MDKPIALVAASLGRYKQFIQDINYRDHDKFVLVLSPEHCYGMEFSAVIRLQGVSMMDEEHASLYNLAMTRVR